MDVIREITGVNFVGLIFCLMVYLLYRFSSVSESSYFF